MELHVRDATGDQRHGDGLTGRAREREERGAEQADLAVGRTTSRMTCQRVAPSERLASMRSWGTTEMTSRLIATKVGRIMTPKHDRGEQQRRARTAGRDCRRASVAKGQEFSQGSTVLMHPRREDQEAPEAVDDARNRGEQLDQRGDDVAEAPRV